MAEAAFARREARRRRILENSQNRLQIISSITSDECYHDAPIRIVNAPVIPVVPVIPVIPDIQQNIDEIPATTESTSKKEPINNGIITTEPISREMLPHSDGDFLLGEGEIANDLGAFASPKPESLKPSLIEKLLRHKYDIVIVSLLVQLLYSFSIITSGIFYLFLPPILYTLTKVKFASAPNTLLSYANILIIFGGLTAQRAEQVLTVLHWANMIAQDLCVYLFVTVCIQSLICIAMKKNST